ncbi:radical SAM protein [Pyrolobus fumarii]|nr:radical SAM protein [Pyrolobus fumarii]
MAGKWSVAHVKLEDLEVVEAPIYRSTGGPILKTLLSQACRMDCLYCPYRVGGPLRERSVWSPEKLVRVTLELWRRGEIRGLFLSSGFYGDPEVVVEAQLEVARRLREAGFKGYLHLRLMPGTPGSLIREALRLADRVGVNLESVGPAEFAEIAPSKGSWSLDLMSKLMYAARVAGNPRRVDTQLVVGAAGESDEEILKLTASLVKGGVGIVHYSPYTPVPGTPLAEKRPPVPKRRAQRLYEALALLRDYGMSLGSILDILDERGMLPLAGPSLKEIVARAHPEWFPVDPHTASLEELLRVPGIGPRTAREIIRARREGRLDVYVLRRILGPRWRRAARYLAF